MIIKLPPDCIDLSLSRRSVILIQQVLILWIRELENKINNSRNIRPVDYQDLMHAKAVLAETGYDEDITKTNV